IYGEVNLSSSEEQGNFKYIHYYQNKDEKNTSRTLPYGMNDDDYFRIALIQILSDMKDSFNRIGNLLSLVSDKLDKLQNKVINTDSNKINKSEKEETVGEADKVKLKSTATKSVKVNEK
ncbi:MAG: hypothetical protein LIR50_05505, partial [Bacillota bacterium]|nr:hypothetical protein [Bacillota bacterium]